MIEDWRLEILYKQDDEECAPERVPPTTLEELLEIHKENHKEHDKRYIGNIIGMVVKRQVMENRHRQDTDDLQLAQYINRYRCHFCKIISFNAFTILHLPFGFSDSGTLAPT